MQRRRSEQPVPALLIRPSLVKPGHLGHLGEFPLGSWPLLISHSHPPTCHGCKVTVCSPSPWCQKEVVTAGTGPQSRALRETLTPSLLHSTQAKWVPFRNPDSGFGVPPTC